MLDRLRRNLTYANVMSTVAVMFAVGGGAAYAAGSIGSAEVIDESIQSVDLKNGDVRGADLGANAVVSSKVADASLTPFDIQPESLSSGRVFGLDGTDIDDSGLSGADIAANSIKGADVEEASLGKVPAAVDADKLGGVAAEPVVHPVAPGSTDGDRCSAGTTGAFCSVGVSGFGYAPWGNHGAPWQPAAYSKDAFGVVHLEGVVRDTSPIAFADNSVFILPEGYRPAASHIFIVTGREQNDPDEANGRIDIDSAGRVALSVRPDSDPESYSALAHLSLDGISFRAG